MFLRFSETDFINLLSLYFQWFHHLNYWHMFLLFPGKFGAGVQSYFSFLRFLVLLNFIMFIMMFSFVTVPIIIFKYGIFNSTVAYISPKNIGKHIFYVQLL